MSTHINLTKDIETLALSIERLGLALPALILLEACKPLQRLASHAFELLPQPSQALENPFAQLVRDPQQIEALLVRLENGAKS